MSSSRLPFIQRVSTATTLPSPPSPKSFTLPSPFEPSRALHHRAGDGGRHHLELQSVTMPPITAVSPSPDPCPRLPSLQHMLTSPPPDNRSDIASPSRHAQQHQPPCRAKRMGVLVHPVAGIVKRNKHKHHADTRGLRHFSKQVCDTVERKGVTTYSEVADELALSIRAKGGSEISPGVVGQKNIRRRVYDALNVLMATGIITKDKKRIQWVGSTAAAAAAAHMDALQPRLDDLQAQIHQEQDRQMSLTASVEMLGHLIRDKVTQHVQLCHLVWRNEHRAQADGQAPRVQLPFFIVTSLHEMSVQVGADGDRAEISDIGLPHDEARIIYEDADVLESLGLSHVSREQFAAWLPSDPALHAFVPMRPCTSRDG